MIPLNKFIELQAQMPAFRRGLPPLVARALSHYGTIEVPGEADNPEILRWVRTMEDFYRARHALTGAANDLYRADDLAKYQHDAQEWCALFTGWCLFQEGYELPKYIRWSWAYATWFEPVLGKPQPGDIGVTWRGKKEDQIGHAFIICDQIMPSFVEGIGGNQSDAVNIKTIRVDQRLLGFRRPTEKWRRAA